MVADKNIDRRYACLRWSVTRDFRLQVLLADERTQEPDMRDLGIIRDVSQKLKLGVKKKVNNKYVSVSVPVLVFSMLADTKLVHYACAVDLAIVKYTAGGTEYGLDAHPVVSYVQQEGGTKTAAALKKIQGS